MYLLSYVHDFIASVVLLSHAVCFCPVLDCMFIFHWFSSCVLTVCFADISAGLLICRTERTCLECTSARVALNSVKLRTVNATPGNIWHCVFLDSMRENCLYERLCVYLILESALSAAEFCALIIDS